VCMMKALQGTKGVKAWQNEVKSNHHCGFKCQKKHHVVQVTKMEVITQGMNDTWAEHPSVNERLLLNAKAKLEKKKYEGDMKEDSIIMGKKKLMKANVERCVQALLF
jgi:hypothetical protein